eukprot:18298_1
MVQELCSLTIKNNFYQDLLHIITAHFFNGFIPVYTYDLVSKKWTNTNKKMPINDGETGYGINEFGYVKTENEKYVIFIGGRMCGTLKKSDIILVYDTEQGRFFESSVKSPNDEDLGNPVISNAVITNDGNIHLFHLNKHYTTNVNNILDNITFKDTEQKELERMKCEKEYKKFLKKCKKSEKEYKERREKEYKERLNELQKQFNDECLKLHNENAIECENMLRKWNLSQYINILIIEQGYDDMQDWIDLSVNELQQMGFKPGHCKKFKRKVKEHFIQ